MGKRALWFALGAGAGAVSAVWGISSVRRANDRLRPDQVSSRTVERVRGLGGDLREAVVEGRAAMQARERELRERETSRGHA